MPTNSKSKVKTTKKVQTKPVIWYKRWYFAIKVRLDAYMDRRPHRSFRRTRRRDYVRPLVLPKVLSFTFEVNSIFWKYRRLFLPLMVIYILLYSILVGIGSQDTYVQVTEFMNENGGSLLQGGWAALTQTGLTIATLAMSGLNSDLNDGQQIFAVLLGVMAWLTIVWLLRNILAGNKVKMRDGLYNAGAPLISSLIIVLVIALQLVPVALAAVGYSAAVASGLIAGGGVAAMLFWAAAAVLALLSLYLITSSLFALVIVTLPGMYPYRAIKTAGDIVLGRRVKLLLRVLWMALCIVILWLVIMLPLILIDMWLKGIWTQISWVPIVPVGLLIASTLVIFWGSTYVYLLYRKVVDGDTE